MKSAAPSAVAGLRQVAALEAAGWIVVERPDGWVAELGDGSRGVYAATLADLVRRIAAIR